MKLKRKFVNEKYRTLIDAMYDEQTDRKSWGVAMRTTSQS
jgi:hypothetical protein